MPPTLGSVFISWRYIPKGGIAGTYANFVCFEEVTNGFPGLGFNRIFLFSLLKIVRRMRVKAGEQLKLLYPKEM